MHQYSTIQFSLNFLSCKIPRARQIFFFSTCLSSFLLGQRMRDSVCRLKGTGIVPRSGFRDNASKSRVIGQRNPQHRKALNALCTGVCSEGHHFAHRKSATNYTRSNISARCVQKVRASSCVAPSLLPIQI